MSRLKLASIFIGAALAPSVALATFHEIRMVEVFAGSAAAPNAQYVIIQMTAPSEIQIGGQPLRVFDSNGVQTQQFIFPADLPGTNISQPKVLFATSEAAALFSITPDLQVALNLPRAGGKVCYGNDDNNTPIDCVSWGNYVGDPRDTGLPFVGQASFPLGQALKRRLDIAGDPNLLALNDDTGQSDFDFRAGTPSPINFTGDPGIIPPSTCGDNIAEGIEGCDDGNNANGDECNNACLQEFCGDGELQVGEACDDGDGDSTDGCTNACEDPVCGDGSIREGVEECDDGDLTPGDGCDANCNFEGLAGCGNGDLNGAEECDDGNLITGDGCDGACQDETCGDGSINDFPNESCDDGNNTSGDGCSADCQAEGCGDGVVNGQEECDDGNTFAADGCDQACRVEACGNGRQDFGESCDDGNATSGDGCESGCSDTVQVGGGDCSTGGGAPGGLWLFGMFGVVCLLRRRQPI